MILNLFGVAFAIAAIVLYSIDIAFIGLWCDDDDYWYLVLVSVENVVSAVQKVMMSVKKEGFIYFTESLKSYYLQTYISRTLQN